MVGRRRGTTSFIVPLRGLFVFVTTLSADAWSAPAGDAAESAASYLAQLVGGLVLVLGLILVLAWILRRLPTTQVQGRQAIEILAVRSLGARERLVLVQLGEEQILIGVAPSGIRHLHTLKTNLDVVPAQAWSGDFASLLRRAGGKGTDQ